MNQCTCGKVSCNCPPPTVTSNSVHTSGYIHVIDNTDKKILEKLDRIIELLEQLDMRSRNK